jgi:hypothetical protein
MSALPPKADGLPIADSDLLISEATPFLIPERVGPHDRT